MAETRYPITVTFGKQTFKHSATQVLCVGWEITPDTGGDNPLSYPNTSFIQGLLKSTCSNSVQPGASKHNGMWYTYNFEQGSNLTLLRFTYINKVERVIRANSSLLFLLDTNGPPVKIGVTTAPDADSKISELTILYARGYIVKPKQAMQLWGMEIPRGILSNVYVQEEVDEDYDIMVVGDDSVSPYIPIEKDLLGNLQRTIPVRKRPRRKLVTR